MEPSINHVKLKWYDRRCLIILLLIVFWPLGIYGLLKSGRFTRKVKLAVTITIGSAIVILLCLGKDKNTPPLTDIKSFRLFSSGHGGQESSGLNINDYELISGYVGPRARRIAQLIKKENLVSLYPELGELTPLQRKNFLTSKVIEGYNEKMKQELGAIIEKRYKTDILDNAIITRSPLGTQCNSFCVYNIDKKGFVGKISIGSIIYRDTNFNVIGWNYADFFYSHNELSRLPFMRVDGKIQNDYIHIKMDEKAGAALESKLISGVPNVYLLFKIKDSLKIYKNWPHENNYEGVETDILGLAVEVNGEVVYSEKY